MLLVGYMKINIVWFKRDLRLRDHAPLAKAIEKGLPILLLYVFEPSVMAVPEHSQRHWRFVWQSLGDLNQQLRDYGAEVLVCHNEVLPVLEQLGHSFEIQQLFAHQETGQKVTFDRDKQVKSFCKNAGIQFREYVQDGVIRGLSHRANWEDHVSSFFSSPVIHPKLDQLQSVQLSTTQKDNLTLRALSDWITESKPGFQPGGEQKAWLYVKSFFAERIEQYSKQLSKPLASRRSCSRLSPYLAYGNISARELMQYAAHIKKEGGKEKWNVENFQSRLWWRSHYIQKLESEWQIEFEPINRGMKALNRKYDERLFQAWAKGQTGFPLIDASMRCLTQTGWLNFRMRAMLATFASFPLWLPWKPVANHLARIFLDYDPGIHFAQFQMQAGTTGYHTLRIYNPNKQATDNDPEGKFIRKWVPELQNVPPPLLFQPWKMTTMDQVFYQTTIGEDYPQPIIDFEKEMRESRDQYWEVRQRPTTLAHLPSVWQRHCTPANIKEYEQLNLIKQ
jgi:deoxyribodipyrimidine photo-lyase